MPLTGMLCGEPVALSVAMRVALSLPDALGLKAMERVQLAPAANEAEQVLDWIKKSLALSPENA